MFGLQIHIEIQLGKHFVLFQLRTKGFHQIGQLLLWGPIFLWGWIDVLDQLVSSGKYLPEQMIFGLEMVKYQTFGNIGLLTNHRDRRIFEPSFGKQLGGNGDDLFFLVHG